MHEQRITVNVNEANQLRSAIHKRAVDVLGIYYVNDAVAEECVEDDVKYRGRFISKCYVDARKYSRLGTPYYATLQRDFAEVLDYISEWVPMVGVNGYKSYLDERDSIRNEKKKRTEG